MSAFIKDPKNICYEGEDDDEQILYVIRRSRLTNLKWLFGVFIMLFVPIIAGPFITSFNYQGTPFVSQKLLFLLNLSWYLMVFGIFLFNYLSWFFNVYIITSKKILDFDFYGLTYKNITEASLNNIEDVTSKISGPLSMIFNIGNVFIQTAGEKSEFDFDLVDDPGKIRDIIADMVAKERKDPHANN